MQVLKNIYIYLQLGLALGLVLAVILGIGLRFGARLFTKDSDVLRLIAVGIPVSELSAISHIWLYNPP